MNKYREKGDVMTVKILYFKAEPIGDDMFGIFVEEKKIYTVYVNKCESHLRIDGECDETSRDVGCAVDINISRITDDTENTILVDASLFTQIVAAITICCFELYLQRLREQKQAGFENSLNNSVESPS